MSEDLALEMDKNNRLSVRAEIMEKDVQLLKEKILQLAKRLS